jgi:DNA-binding IclR family transcriptional regulator
MTTTDTTTVRAGASPRIVQSVVHASSLLKALQKAGRSATLSELARKIGLSKPATYALLRTLELDGLVAKDQAARYQLSWGLYELGSAVSRSLALTKVARLHLDRLAVATGEAVLLGILDNRSVLYLDRGQLAESFRMVANIGRRSPLHTTASGKVLLAGQDKPYLDALLEERLAPTTSKTITDPAELRLELDRVRQCGYAMCRQEQEIGLSSIAVPVCETATVRAALAIAGPTNRIEGASQPRLFEALSACAAEISRQLP